MCQNSFRLSARAIYEATSGDSILKPISVYGSACGLTWSIKGIFVVMETGQELDQDVSTTRMQFAERQTTDVTPDVERIADSFTYVTLAQ